MMKGKVQKTRGGDLDLADGGPDDPSTDEDWGSKKMEKYDSSEEDRIMKEEENKPSSESDEFAGVSNNYYIGTSQQKSKPQQIPICQYGRNCYRKNPQHFSTFYTTYLHYCIISLTKMYH